MSVTHLDEVLRQRNQFREELANVRCERDSQHALTTLLRNSNDRLESENVDLRTKITNLQAQIANTRKQTLQRPTLPSGSVVIVDGDDDDKNAVLPSVSKKSVEYTVAAKSLAAESTDLKAKQQPPLPIKRRRSETDIDLSEQQDVTLTMLKRVKVQDESDNANDGNGIVDSHSSLGASSEGQSETPPFSVPPSSMVPNNGHTSKVLDTGAFILPLERIAHHLNGCHTLNVSPSPVPTSISRACLLKHYGTNTQQFIGTVRYKGTPHAAVFAQPGQNPFLPRYPGARGLLFASRHEVLTGVHMLFVKLERGSSKETPLWEYRGGFESVLSAKMTPAEFNMQRDDVKVNWAKHLLQKVKWECYTSMRARIYLRKKGRLPSDEKSRVEAVNQEVNRIRKHQGGNLSVEEVIAALARGDEGIDVITMKCVEYDHEFAQHLRNASSGGVDQQGNSKLTAGISGTKQKRKAEIQKSDSDSDIELDNVPSGSSSGVRRSARQPHPRVIAN